MVSPNRYGRTIVKHMGKALLAVATAATLTGLAFAKPYQYYYYTLYYSDASLSQQVGSNYQICHYGGLITNEYSGQVTPHSEVIFQGRCYQGGDLD